MGLEALLIFLIIGGIMSLYGFFTRHAADLYQKSMGINLNLTWGLLMALFGLIMFMALGASLFYFARKKLD